VDHAVASFNARQQPGRWIPLGEYRGPSGADSAAFRIRTAYREAAKHYAPAGAFDARTERTDNGTTVWVRYQPT